MIYLYGWYIWTRKVDGDHVTPISKTTKKEHGAFGYDMSYQRYKNKTKAMITGFCTSLLAGVAKEVFDNARGGVLDKRDILATGMGGLFVTFTIPVLQKKNK